MTAWIGISTIVLVIGIVLMSAFEDEGKITAAILTGIITFLAFISLLISLTIIFCYPY